MSPLKFDIHAQSTEHVTARIGRLSITKADQDGADQSVTKRAIETPGCLMSTLKGSVPHLTPDTMRLQDYGGISAFLEQILQADQPGSFSKWPSASTSSRFTLADYLHLQDLILFCDLRDFSSPSPGSSKLGSNTDRHVLLSTIKGVRQLSLDEYLDIVRQYRPDIMVSLTDHITETKEPDQRRVRKSSDRTLKWLDQILLERQGQDGRIEDRKKEEEKKRKKAKKEKRRNAPQGQQQQEDEQDVDLPVDVQPIATESWTDVAVFAHVQGAHYEEERIWSAKETAKRDGVDGFIVNVNSLISTTSKDEVLKNIQISLEHLPSQKPRLVYGIQAPEDVLKAAALGVDLFDTSYPHQLTEDGKASLYFFGDNPYPLSDNNNNDRWINLWDEEHKDKFVPIMRGCECCACKGGKHTRAYINHLLKAHEMLATVLLMSHNLYQYSKFFSAVREAIKAGTLERHSKVFHDTFGVEPVRTGEKHPAQIVVEASLSKRNQRLDGIEAGEVEAIGMGEKGSKRSKDDAGVDRGNKRTKVGEDKNTIEEDTP
ncbi:tRNA-guanine(15) transglycosylase-like protein [Mortierella sp. GBAus27b]|nr:tRNA-guanine(15) transglycosylase-like protein [Mortierella sp. GBAus27b]